MDKHEYQKKLNSIRDLLTKYKNTSNMSKKEKDDLIKELQEENARLTIELQTRKNVDGKYITALTNNKYDEIMKLLYNPILTLPSGKQIEFSSLSDEQLEYLESLSTRQKKL